LVHSARRNIFHFFHTWKIDQCSGCLFVDVSHGFVTKNHGFTEHNDLLVSPKPRNVAGSPSCHRSFRAEECYRPTSAGPRRRWASSLHGIGRLEKDSHIGYVSWFVNPMNYSWL
jgi:hypothetical protein